MIDEKEQGVTENGEPRILSEAEYLEDDREVAAINAAIFEKSKQEALASGKEPFDLDKFDALYTAPYAKTERTRDRAERVRSWEIEYYTRTRDDVRTVAEFAERKRYNDENWI